MGAGFAQATEGGPPAIYNIGFLLLLVGIFYVLLLRPEQKRRKEHEEMVGNLKRNDQIVLASGIHGRVAALGEKVIAVEIAPKVQVQVDRSAVQSVQKAGAAEVREKEGGKP
jgi:preprotein translocase subunit YajC